MEIFAIILMLAIAVLVIHIPIFIARGRGISGSNMTAIIVLSWLGFFFGLTWIIALVLSLAWGAGADLNKLEALQRLKKSGAISQKEFDAEKRKILQ